MKVFEIEKVINSNRSEVWDTLTKFPNYENWNSIVPFGSGDLVVGGKLDMKLKMKGKKIKKFMPKIESVIQEHEFILSQTAIHKKIAYIKHYFILQKFNETNTKFVQRWECSGILIPILWQVLVQSFKEFEAFNTDLSNQLTVKLKL